MISFKQFITETIDNLFVDDKEKRELYVDQVWDILNHSYAKIGGIHGSGFKNKEDMINNLPLWKLYRKGDKIKTVVMYKSTNGRKSVALGTDGSPEAKQMAQKIKADEFKTERAYGEVSDNSLYFLIKTLGIKILDHIIPYEKAVIKANENGDEIEPKSIKAESRFVDGVIEYLHSKDSYKLNLSDKEKLKIIEELTKACYRRKIGDHYHTKVMMGNINSEKIKKFK